MYNLDVENYLNTIIKEGMTSSRAGFLYRLNTIFEGIDFRKKRFLDIGGGDGLYSFYAASRGAEEVLCLEPDIEGSSAGTAGKFHKLQTLLNYTNVFLEPVTFQSFAPNGRLFDIIFLHNSINHLNEKACSNLLKDQNSRSVYREVFEKFHRLSDTEAKLIICDCSRNNLFAFFGIHNPFAAPSIEWHKHQAPEVWADLLKEAGFMNPEIVWPSYKRLHQWARIFVGAKLAAYLLTSHFCLRMEKNCP